MNMQCGLHLHHQTNRHLEPLTYMVRETAAAYKCAMPNAMNSSARAVQPVHPQEVILPVQPGVNMPLSIKGQTRSTLYAPLTRFHLQSHDPYLSGAQSRRGPTPRCDLIHPPAHEVVALFTLPRHNCPSQRRFSVAVLDMEIRGIALTHLVPCDRSRHREAVKEIIPITREGD